jgi:hypothetical protein
MSPTALFCPRLPVTPGQPFRTLLPTLRLYTFLFDITGIILAKNGDFAKVKFGNIEPGIFSKRWINKKKGINWRFN